MLPRISIIVPNYNHAPFLKKRLDSIFNQTFKDFEVLLLDDCSTDGSVEILKEYANNASVSHFVINNRNSGSTFAQWKKGIELAKGDLIWIAESDDVAKNNFLESLIPAFDKYDNLAIAYSQSDKIDETGQVIGTWKTQTDNYKLWENSFYCSGIKVLQEYMIYQNIIPNASAVLFKPQPDIIPATSFTINGDWLFWSQLLQKGWLYYHDERLNQCRFHSQKGSSRNIENFNNVSEYYKLISFFKSIIGKETKERVVKNIFLLWINQKLGRGQHIFSQFFFKVLLSGFRTDKKIIIRMFFYGLRKLQEKVKNIKCKK